MAGPCHRDGISELYQRIWIGFLERAWRECVHVCDEPIREQHDHACKAERRNTCLPHKALHLEYSENPHWHGPIATLSEINWFEIFIKL